MSDTIPIGLLANVSLGKMLQKNQRTAGEELRPYLRAAHVQPEGRLDLKVEPNEMWFNEHEVLALDLRRGDVVVVEGGVGGYGRAAWIAEDIVGWGYQNSIVRLRPNAGVDGRFVAHALVAARKNGAIAAECFGAGMPHFPAEKVARFRIPFHPPRTQRRIADFLDRETAEIDAMDVELDRLVETLQERRSSMVRRALTGYPLVAMGYHCRIVNGSTPLISRTDYWTESGGFPWLNSSAVNEAVVVQASREVTPAALRECHLPLVHPGDLLIGITGQGRTRGMVAMSGVECTISQHLAAIQPQSGWEAKFLYYALTADYLELRQQSEGAGSTKGAITCQMLTQYKVPLPPLPEQQRIVAELDEQTGRIDSMIADARRLKALLAERRTTLITDVVTGRKEV